MNVYRVETNLIDTRKKLGFRINDQVRLTRKLFTNHGLEYIDIGVGTVYGKELPTENNLPHIIVQFKIHPDIFACKLLFDMLFIRANADKSEKVLMSVHPMYLEQVEMKKSKRK